MQSLLNLLPQDVLAVLPKFRFRVAPLPGANGTWNHSKRMLTLSDKLGSDPVVLKALLWHEMTHWLWTNADSHDRLAAWRKDLQAHFYQCTKNCPSKTDQYGNEYIPDDFIEPAAGYVYPGQPGTDGMEMLAVYVEVLSRGDKALNNSLRKKAGSHVTFDLILSIFKRNQKL